MQVSLIQKELSQDAIINKMYIAARTCYSNHSPIKLEVYAESKTIEQKIKLIEQVLSSGHTSIAEHIQLTFAIEGISRSCSHQLVRHRLAVYSQQSQRYTVLDSENPDYYIIPESIAKTFSTNDDLAIGYTELMKTIQDFYNKCVEAGIKAEDARYVLPNAAKTNITFSCNLRELMHICNLRLCKRAQWEIREVFNQIALVTGTEYPFLKRYLVPQCEALGYCPEHESCGRKAKIEF